MGEVATNKKREVRVGVLMGSDTDLPVMSEAGKVLDKFGIGYEMEVMSAHRTPVRAHEYATTAQSRGLKVLIAAAGAAAHLAGVIAANTTLPVIGVPMGTSSLNGLGAKWLSIRKRWPQRGRRRMRVCRHRWRNGSKAFGSSGQPQYDYR